MIRPIQICGSDTTMDHRNLMGGGPGINPLPPACPTCRFPDIDFIPNPYYLIRPRATSSKEFAPAELGNLLVKHRVKQIFETAIPELCTFHPTYFQNSTEITPWLLAVPKRFGSTGVVSSKIERCNNCGQPVSAHPGKQYESREIQSKYDLAKSLNWASAPDGWYGSAKPSPFPRWLSRDTIMSVRLYRLLKALKIKSLDESTGGNRPETKPTKEELTWIDQQRRVLENTSTSQSNTSELSTEESVWLDQFIKTRPRPEAMVAAPTTTSAWKVPPSFARVIEQLGALEFSNIDDTDERVALTLPEQWRTHSLMDETNRTDDGPQDPVVFASTHFGDEFCFDRHDPGPEYPVYRYNHEIDCYEPYSQDFVQLLQRFTAASK
jgi:hypothetical protein